MPCSGKPGSCFSPGVGPHCDPTAITVKTPDNLLANSGFSSVSFKESDQAKLGANRKKKCLEDEQERIKAYIHSCICDCAQLYAFPDSATLSAIAGNGNGVPQYCYATCVDAAIAQMDWTKCYCMETSCGGSSDDNTDSTSSDSSNDSTTDSASGVSDGNDKQTRYDYAKLGPEISSLSSTSTYDMYIPRIYSRGAVGGNLIWAGNARKIVRHVIETETDTSGNLTVTDTEVTQSFVDFALAVCEGPIVGIARMWINGALIYNNILNTDESGAVVPTDGYTVLQRENFGFFSKIDNKDKYLDTIATLTVYTGAEDQLPVVPGGVAYRGLAYILVENFDLSFTNGTVPEIRVDVVQQDGNIVPYQLTSGVASTGAVLLADEDNRRLVVDNKLLDYDSLAVLSTVAPAPQSGAAVDAAGNVGYVNSSTLEYLNITTGVGGATIAPVPAFTAAAFAQPREQSTAIPDYYVGAYGGAAYVYRSDDFGTKWTAKGTIAGFSDYTVRDMFAFSDDNGTDITYYLTGISTPDGSLPAIYVRSIILYDTDTHPWFDLQTPAFGFDYVLDNLPWGRESQAKLIAVVRDLHDNGLIFFVKGSNNYLFKWDYTTNTVVWQTTMPESPSGRVSHSSKTFSELVFVGENGGVYGLTLRDGTYTKLKDAQAPMLGSAQHYDVTVSSVTYVRPDGAVAREFVGRLTSAPVSLADLLVEIMAASGLSPEGVNADDVYSVTASGYQITSQTTARAALTQLMLIYGLTARESNGTLTISRNSLATNTNVTMDAISERTKDYARNDHDALINSAEIGYLSTDNDYTETKQIARFPSAPDGSKISLSFPVLLTDLQAAHLTERLVSSLASDTLTCALSLSPSYLHLEPGDYVTVYGNEDGGTQFRIETTNVGADKSMDVTLVRDSLSLYTEEANITAQLVSTGNVTDTTAFIPVSTPRPLLVMTNAILNEHIPDLATGKNVSVFYAGVDYRGPLPMAPIDLHLDTNGVMVRSATVTEPLFWGSVVSLSVPNDSSEYTIDDDDILVVKFVRPEFIDRVKSVATVYDLDDLRTNLLVVNNEIIQFTNVSVDVDGLTATFTGLLRGRRGTEWARDSQPGNGVAVLYTEAGCAKITQVALFDPQIATVGVRVTGSRFLKANKANYHYAMRPYAPGNLSRTQFSTGDIAFTFQRRSRIAEADNAGRDLDSSHPGLFTYSITKDFDNNADYDIYILRRPLSVAEITAAVEYLDIPGAQTHPDVVRWIKAYGLSDYVNVDYVWLEKFYTALYTNQTQAQDGFDYATDDLHIVVYQRGGGFTTRGHPAYTTFEPVP